MEKRLGQIPKKNKEKRITIIIKTMTGGLKVGISSPVDCLKKGIQFAVKNSNLFLLK